MDKIGLFYSFKSHKTKKIAEKILERFGAGQMEAVDAETITANDFLRFNRMILGVPTWFDGELPNYWDEFVPALKELDLSGKRIAIYGLADQVGYPENFGDAVGIMAQLLISRHAQIVGFTSPEGYRFESSRALINNMLSGLIIDQDNQARLTEDRLAHWIEQLEKEL